MYNPLQPHQITNPNLAPHHLDLLKAVLGQPSQHVGVPAPLTSQQQQLISGSLGRAPSHNANLIDRLKLQPHQKSTLSHSLNTVPNNNDAILAALWLGTNTGPGVKTIQQSSTQMNPVSNKSPAEALQTLQDRDTIAETVREHFQNYGPPKRNG